MTLVHTPGQLHQLSGQPATTSGVQSDARPDRLTPLEANQWGHPPGDEVCDRPRRQRYHAAAVGRTRNVGDRSIQPRADLTDYPSPCTHHEG